MMTTVPSVRPLDHLHGGDPVARDGITSGFCQCGCGRKTWVPPRTYSRKGLIKGVPRPYYGTHGPVQVNPESYRKSDGCWEWLRAKAGGGYGRVCINGRLLQAHRVVYEQFVGPIPAGLHLDHLCRNPGCVNPAHLEPVTCVENIRRGVWPKLTLELTEQIRHEYAKGDTSHAALGRKYGVTDRTIARIVQNRGWLAA